MMKTRSQVLIQEQLPVTTSEVAADLCETVECSFISLSLCCSEEEEGHPV